MGARFRSRWQKIRLWFDLLFGSLWWEKIRSWLGWLWEKIKQHLVAIGVGVLLVLILFIFLAYLFGWSGVGFNGGYPKITTTKITPGTTVASEQQPAKTLWDWMQLLFIPVVLAIAGFWFNHRERKAEEAQKQREEDAAKEREKLERESREDNQREIALQAYIDKMSELLLKEHLGERTADGKINPEMERTRKIARVRTITVLTHLDARRIGYVFAFLREAGLMSTTSNDNVVSLDHADLHAVDWSEADLSQANLSEAILTKADLSQANLSEANLSGATINYARLNRTDLSQANLSSATIIEANLNEVILCKANLSRADLSNSYLGGANLGGADLSEASLSNVTLNFANLSEARVTDEQLAKARSMEHATMPDGSIHP